MLCKLLVNNVTSRVGCVSLSLWLAFLPIHPAKLCFQLSLWPSWGEKTGEEKQKEKRNPREEIHSMYIDREKQTRD
jgi:hypothetical protein